jgi:hypothetical protein
MARRKADRPTDGRERRAETAAVATYLTALRAPKVPARSRDALRKRRAQIEQWLAEEASPIREVELIQQRIDIDAQLAQIDQAARLPELGGSVRERGRLVGEAQRYQCGGATRGGCTGQRSSGLASCEGGSHQKTGAHDSDHRSDGSAGWMSHGRRRRGGPAILPEARSAVTGMAPSRGPT